MGGYNNVWPSWMIEELLKDLKENQKEFCPSCGAGIGKHHREGEGTCPNCDPKEKE